MASVPGVVAILEVADGLKVAAREAFREKVFATPAIAGNLLFVGTTSHRYALGE
jgi:3-dehydroquinate dehydratase